jgi:predicted RNase H-like nuclease (RuvC/YqgF family)
MWKLFFKTKEKKMATTSESNNKTTTQLKKRVEEQKKTIGTALKRISALSDEISILRHELKRFKNDVGEDVKYLTQRVDG